MKNKAINYKRNKYTGEMESGDRHLDLLRVGSPPALPNLMRICSHPILWSPNFLNGRDNAFYCYPKRLILRHRIKISNGKVACK
jgi:uncharacterized protein YbgA (DUF1722 family)